MERSVVFTRAAARSLTRMPRNTEMRIRGKLRQLAADPDALVNKALKGGANRYRLRVDDRRAIFTTEPDRIIVHEIGPRGTVDG